MYTLINCIFGLLFLSIITVAQLDDEQFMKSLAACDAIHRLQNYEEKIYSQNGEDGVLVALLDLIGAESRYYVEFGVEDGFECNSRVLREHFGFQGLMMDGGYENAGINLKKEFITESNVADLFMKHGVPQSFDVLSVDVDMFDFWILSKILRSGYRPRIVIVETNPTLCLNGAHRARDYSLVNSVPLTVLHPNMTDQKVWDLTRYSGANPMAFRELGLQFGYEMVYCERCGVNCILVLNSALPLSCQRRTPPAGAAINTSDLALYKNTAILGGFSMPLVPYPCFGTARTGGAIPGHEYDPKERSAVLLQPELLQKVVTGQVAISDIESSMTSCESNHSRPDSLLAGHIRSQIRERDPAKAADAEMAEYDIEIAFDARATWDQTGEAYKLYLRASLCDDVEKRSLEFCAQHDTVKGNCDLVREALQREFDKREKDRAVKVCPNRS